MSEKVFFIAFLRYVYCFGTPSSEVMSNGREKSQPVRTLNAKHQKNVSHIEVSATMQKTNTHTHTHV